MAKAKSPGSTTAAKKKSTPSNSAAPRQTNNSAKEPAMPQALPVASYGSYGPSEDEIRQRAYELYEQDGYHHGRHEDHWHRAAAELKEKYSKKKR